MSGSPPDDDGVTLKDVRALSVAGNINFTRHAVTETSSRGISLAEVSEAIASGEILENYPDYPRGPCCLVNGITAVNRPLHIVCTTAQLTLIIVTAYEPRMPKWRNPRERNR